MISKKLKTRSALQFLTVAFAILVLYGLSVGVVAATYYDYGTCQSENVYSAGNTLYPLGDGIYADAQIYSNGSMNSSFYVESNGGPYVEYDHFEYQAYVLVHYSGTLEVDVGYTYGGQVYKVLSKGSPPISTQQINSTTIMYTIGTAGTGSTYALIYIDVASNQFLSPYPALTYWCGVTADSNSSFVQLTSC